MLILGLGLVVYLMYALNTKGLPGPLAELFGTGSDRLKWCDTRVLATIRPDEYKLEQIDRRWMVEGSFGTRQADFLEVEKWFVDYCNVPGKLQAGLDAQDFKAALVVKFIDGQIEVLKQAQDQDIYSWRGQVFAAPKLTEGLQALSRLASAQSTSPVPTSAKPADESEH